MPWPKPPKLQVGVLKVGGLVCPSPLLVAAPPRPVSLCCPDDWCDEEPPAASRSRLQRAMKGLSTASFASQAARYSAGSLSPESSLGDKRLGLSAWYRRTVVTRPQAHSLQPVGYPV
jgi:hypothetical protein